MINLIPHKMEREQKTQVVQFFQMSMDDLKEFIKEAVISGAPPINNTNETLSASSDNEWLTREEVKGLLKISYTTLWKYNRNGILKAKKIGSRVYYSRTELNNLLNNAA